MFREEEMEGWPLPFLVSQNACFRLVSLEQKSEFRVQLEVGDI